MIDFIKINPFFAVGHPKVRQRWIEEQIKIINEIGVEVYFSIFASGLMLSCSDLGFTTKWGDSWISQQPAKLTNMGCQAYFTDLLIYLEKSIGSHWSE